MSVFKLVYIYFFVFSINPIEDLKYAYLHILSRDMYAIILDKGSLSTLKVPKLHESSVPKL